MGIFALRKGTALTKKTWKLFLDPNVVRGQAKLGPGLRPETMDLLEKP